MQWRWGLCALALASGCLTVSQDGHRDACREARSGSYNRDLPLIIAQQDHDQCVYSPEPLPDVPDPDAYEKGWLRGFEDCVRQPYIDEWVALDEASPCDAVTGTEDPP